MAQLLTYEDVQAAFSQLSSTSGVSLRPGLGAFLRRPIVWDPEAEGWRILVNINLLGDDQQNRLEGAVRGAGFMWRRINKGGLGFLEIYAPEPNTQRISMYLAKSRTRDYSNPLRNETTSLPNCLPE
jgi:hypothetical protein